MSEERAHPISIEFAKQLEDAIFTGKVNLEEAGLIVAVDIADILDEILIVELPKLLSAQLATIEKAVEGLKRMDYKSPYDGMFAIVEKQDGRLVNHADVLQAIRKAGGE